MNSLIPNMNYLKKKMEDLPPIELSYETFVSHKKEPVDSEKYPVALIVPKSKKYVAWFTFIGKEDVCILLELSRDKRIVNYQTINVVFDTKKPRLALGTFFYGSLVNYVPENKDGMRTYFVIEDMLMYKSVSLRKLCFGDRLGMIRSILSDTGCLPGYMDGSSFAFVLPVMVDTRHIETVKLDQFHYPIHHIQYRSLTKIIPCLNELYVPYTKPSPSKFEASKPPTRDVSNGPPPVPRHYREPLGKERAVFMVSADIQSDIYYLVHPKSMYLTDVAYIPNYKTSVFMNSLFRRIKENQNLDTIEESDDDEEFYDMRYDKYVDLTKTLYMECMYHKKFQRWIPLKVVK